jgi:hypothetical protein
MRKILFLMLVVFLMTTGKTEAKTLEKITIGSFTPEEMPHWEERSFKKHTNYQLVEQTPPLTLRATCKDTASALYRKISVDLTKTPLLHWSWRVDAAHPELKDTTKSGDDYAARVYVVYAPNPLLPWQVKAVDYVWANRQPIGTSWPNAFTNHAMMVAVRSGQPVKQGQWINETRNVRTDFKKFFGMDITGIDGVAVMTDCDNSGLSSGGYYRNIWFSAE